MAFGTQDFCFRKYYSLEYSCLDLKNVHSKGPNFPTPPLNVNMINAAELLVHSSSVLQDFLFPEYVVWQKLRNVLVEATDPVSIIKMEETTTYYFFL